MAVTALIGFTIAAIAWSLWIRRVTWRSRWEVAATVNVALQGCAVVLASPIASETIGTFLHRLTGRWNLEDFLAHDCFIVAATAIIYHALGRLADDDTMQESFRQFVERPATICIPVLLITFSLSNAAQTYRPDFFQLTTDGWLSLYWVLLAAMLIYLLGYASRALLILRKDPRSRRVANIYVLGATSAILACVVRAVTAVDKQIQAVEGGRLVWLFACIAGSICAVASAQAWRQKMRWFQRPRVQL
ncbi:hypothetical protein [Mycobacterium talmoniae]|uniref:GP55 protein n=1 Tax=Mycobacterium talmoniae TaxID=1858794 RepID=A0A1S1NNR8_9MYCO|nr:MULTISPECIES: hypothetical protein [Mycobacterium]OHV05790.1 hypothetical protein BKN37_04275 [Mycobacterium talmoniae]PQM48663.1 hypothetical protein C1Y40_01117 [Mycobacterium talmoniae]TDH57681.1 hypothetical protein E2F47_00390 [Mycobacterium eburneum]